MLIRPVDLARIRAGEIDLAFRRWDKPRVRVGTSMRTSIGLVEVMKSFNEVKAGVAGRIVRFIAENEDPIMAGQPIAEIEV